MSIATEIQRLQYAKTDVRTSLLKKGIYIPTDTLVSSFSTYIDDETPIPWRNNPSKYLSFFFIEDGSVSWQNKKGDIEYSKDGGNTWTFFNENTVTMSKFEEIWFKGSLTSGIGANSGTSSSKFITTGSFFAGGNIFSLCDFSETLQNYHFAYLFKGCSGLNIEKNNPLLLPATTLSNYCYAYMFEDCTYLIKAPKLPATTLTQNCYRHMFYGCSSLEEAPELPATTLAVQCYSEMFKQCSNLKYIKALFTTTPSTMFTQYWVSGVKASGTFVKNASAKWTNTGTSAVPTGWTVETVNYYTV